MDHKFMEPDYQLIPNTNLKKLDSILVGKLVNLIISGKQVSNSPLWVKEKLMDSEYLAIAVLKGEPIGVAALKIQDDTKEQENNYGYYLDESYRHEYGGVATRSEYEGHGICKRLTDSLFEAAGDIPLFAVTRVEKMKAMLVRRKFQQVGHPYKSLILPELDHLSLFIRPKRAV
jgi:hypothetical protein